MINIKLILLAIILLALCVFGMCFNIIFKKDGKFPDTEIEHNKEMRKRGIQCARLEEKKMWGKKRAKAAQTESCTTSDCESCGGGCS